MRKIHRVKKALCKVAAVISLLLVGLYFYRVDETEQIANAAKIQLIERSIQSPLNRGTCHRPDLPQDNPDIMRFYEPTEKINCGSALDDWVTCEKAICFVKPEVSAREGGDIICSYTDLLRKSDYKVRYGRTTSTQEPYVLVETDFVRVACTASASGRTWQGLAYGIRDGVALVNEQLSLGAGGGGANEDGPYHLLPGWNGKKGGPPAVEPKIGGIGSDSAATITRRGRRYNILMLGFDSLSRNAFLRKLPKTYAYLSQQLGGLVLEGYNIVGDGTPQALIPLLTGYTELELPDTRKRKSAAQSVDVYPFVWREAARLGYATAFNEDLPNVGTFTYRMNGFSEQPVDHYMRTLYLESQGYDPPHCLGHSPDHVAMLEYTRNFMNSYRDSPRFVFSFHGGLSHDSINLIGAADYDVVSWLRSLKAKRLLDDTVLILMADHGNRFSEVRATLQGKQEERLPFFSFAMPESFRRHYPRQFANLRENTQRLTTPFDVHATLKDILKLKLPGEDDGLLVRDSRDAAPVAASTVEAARSTPPTPTITISPLAQGRAISLFESVPANRSCADAYIEPHWCACLNWQPLPLNDDPAVHAKLLVLAANVVQTINAATSDWRALCAPLELLRLNWAMRLRPHRELLQYSGPQDVDGYMPDLNGGATSDKGRSGGGGSGGDAGDGGSGAGDDHLSAQQPEELYQLQIVVTPGESLFEASVAVDKRSLTARTKLSEISRVNKYGTQANCIYERNPEIRKYCYCRMP